MAPEMAVSERRGLARWSPAEWGQWLLLLLLCGGCSGRIHRLALTVSPAAPRSGAGVAALSWRSPWLGVVSSYLPCSLRGMERSGAPRFRARSGLVLGTPSVLPMELPGRPRPSGAGLHIPRPLALSLPNSRDPLGGARDPWCRPGQTLRVLEWGPLGAHWDLGGSVEISARWGLRWNLKIFQEMRARPAEMHNFALRVMLTQCGDFQVPQAFSPWTLSGQRNRGHRVWHGSGVTASEEALSASSVTL